MWRLADSILPAMDRRRARSSIVAQCDWLRAVVVLLTGLPSLAVGCAEPAPFYREASSPPTAPQVSSEPPPSSVAVPRLPPSDKPLLINLPSALQLADVQPIDVAIASQRIELAVAQLHQAKVLWLPTLYLGLDYFRHDGRIQ